MRPVKFSNYSAIDNSKVVNRNPALKWIFALLILLVFNTGKVFSQADGKKNSVFVNVTNPLIFGKRNLILGYERVIGKHQSFIISAGTASLPSLGIGKGSDSIKVQGNRNQKGFHISGEYRFYLKKENKYDAPHGLYIGPYYAYNSFSRTNDWLLNTENYDGTVSTKTSLNINTIGAELGYQFIFWKRMTLDLILVGPGVGFYKIKADIGTTLDPDDSALLFQHINDFLGDKIPGYNLVIKEGEFERNGSVKTTTLGYRYMVNIGFRF